MIPVIDVLPASGKSVLARSLACNYFVDAVTLRDKVIAVTGTRLSVFSSKDIEEPFKREPSVSIQGLF
jgi:hypothetical protein